MNSFDLLRLGAALLVVFHHCYPLSGRPPLTLGPVADLGALGVGVFFVVSGYLVTASYRRSRGLWDFLAKRVLRIAPALLVVLILTAFVLGPLVTTAAPADYFASATPYLYVLRNALLYPVTYNLPGVFEHNPFPDAVNGSLWTLRLEFSCYLGVAVLGLMGALTRPVVGVLAVLAALAFVAIDTSHLLAGGGDLVRMGYLAARFGFLFLAGAFLQLDERPPNPWLVAGSAALLLTPAWIFGLPATVLWIGLARGPRLPGDISYGLYIYAFPLQQVLASAGLLSFPAAVAATLPFALASWYLVEKPALRLKPGGRAVASAGAVVDARAA